MRITSTRKIKVSWSFVWLIKNSSPIFCTKEYTLPFGTSFTQLRNLSSQILTPSLFSNKVFLSSIVFNKEKLRISCFAKNSWALSGRMLDNLSKKDKDKDTPSIGLFIILKILKNACASTDSKKSKAP